MKKIDFITVATLVISLTLVLTSCTTNNGHGGITTSDESSSTNAATQSGDTAHPQTTDPALPRTVDIVDIHGTVTVPVNPQRVISLDSRSFETLSDWGVELIAVPKGIMPANSSYVLDDSVQDIGNHREPNLEIIAAADPELVIIGQRFASYYDEIKELVPQAAVINLNIDVSKEAATPGVNLVDGLKDSTRALGLIFDKSAEADKLIAEFDAAIASLKAAYNGTATVMSVIVSGGNIGFSAPGFGRVWGPMYEIFGWISSLDVTDTTANHQGDEISIEAIAQSNPDWLFVLDRDAAISTADGAVPAQDVIGNAPALQNTTAVRERQIVYAPNDTYINESIQTYIELFQNIATALAG